MAGVPEKVLNWLYSVLPSEYADVNRTYHDVAETLSNYPSLSPRTEVYTYENGASALLLRIGGTVPVTFREQIYGFPIVIWIPHNYPRESPIVYVTPSQDMLVRPGQHVSGDGRVYHPYLAQWGKYWDKSTLFDFLAVLRGVFAKEPPVRSRQQQPQHQHTPAPPPVPPPPTEWQKPIQNTSIASPAPGPSDQAPPPPPKPPKPYEQARPSPQQKQDRYSQAPPLPPQQSSQHQINQPHQYQQPHQQPQNNGYATHNHWQQHGPLPQQHTGHPQPTPGPGPATPASNHTRPHVHAQGQSRELRSPVSPSSPENQQRTGRYQQPAPLPQQPQQLAAFPSQQYQAQPQYSQVQHAAPQVRPPQYHNQQQQQQPSNVYPPKQHPPYQQQAPPPPQPAAPPPNLMDMDTDILSVTIPSQAGPQQDLPVPPVPPNPEKDALLTALSTSLIAQLTRTVTQNNAAIAPLQAQQAALQSAYATLQSEIDQLQQLDAALASNENILRDAMREADRVMEDARRRKAPDVDDVLVAPTVVGGQLYSVAAEERALAEALFVLGRALDKGRIGGDVFVKQTRTLAREQFLKKALVKKIARGMGLTDYGMR
ncbi:UEV-domain-containing protein [Periconia macrospinosa]|uniref:UEV-domain-containing protein n=1 Tax=Periconia macrospinosa TaxID=97972 RepID=A0A2V1E3U2_9PLEO|nr:UEV-domain-containing protein [Periconia macrospinosa]